jgi:hypothetical protein
MSLFYRQQGVDYPDFPPCVPIPDAETAGIYEDSQFHDHSTETGEKGSKPSPKPPELFANICRFWRIMHEVTTIYYGNQTASVEGTVSLQFAEFKYRELLAWADRLPVVLARSSRIPDVIVILQ